MDKTVLIISSFMRIVVTPRVFLICLRVREKFGLIVCEEFISSAKHTAKKKDQFKILLIVRYLAVLDHVISFFCTFLKIHKYNVYSIVVL